MKSEVRKVRVLVVLAAVAFLALSGLEAGGLPEAQRRVGPISISVDPRIELVSIVCRLAGYDEYNMKRFPRYDEAVLGWFGPFSGHEAVRLAREVRESDGISFNAPMSLAVIIKDVDSMAPVVPLDVLPDDIDPRWKAETARRFLAALRAFAADSRFEEFLKSQDAMYRTSVARFAAVLEKRKVTPWFDGYFGPRAGADFHLVLGLLNGGANYGASAHEKNGARLYSIIGVWRQDKEGLPVFEDDIIGMVVHEFCHLYTNPVVDRFAGSLERAGAEIFAQVETPMKASAYGDWKIMMYESFVRACVLRYLDAQVGAAAMRQGLEKDIKGSFVWVGPLADLLKDFESDRKAYPAFEDFVPRIAAFFEDYKGEVGRDLAKLKEKEDEKWEKIKAESPKIVRMEPENGAVDVDPGLKEIRIVFDRKMKTDSFALMYAPGEEDQFPEETGKVGYDSDERTLIIPVRLKPGWTYKFGLNSRQAIGFIDRNGAPLYPIKITFKTRAGVLVSTAPVEK